MVHKAKNDIRIPDIPISNVGNNNNNTLNDILDVLLIKPKHNCNCQNGYRCKCGCCYPLHTHDKIECPNKEMDKYQIRMEYPLKLARP